MEKTNVMRLLDKAKIDYEAFCIEATKENTGVEVAEMLKADPNQVFKTLVTYCDKTKMNFVFVIPSLKTLDLKKAASSVNQKNILMHKSKDLLSLTGYVHGGCSPIGMKKTFITVFDISALNYEEIYFSAGKIGYQVKVKVNQLDKIIKTSFKELTE